MNPADTIREATNLIRDAVGFALAEKNIPRAPTWTELVPAHLDAIAAALTELEADRDRLADTLRAVAWKDSDGFCWCPGETEFAVANPGGQHTARCLAARAALDRHTKGETT
jgi:hypothetical protein